MPAIAMKTDTETEAEGTMSEDITLESIGWKRRSGFAKYSDTVGVGSSWERRRFILTAGQLKYYNAPASSSSGAGVSNSMLENEDTPRGTFDLASERTTVIATYPADPSQPTPYALSVNLDGGADKWKMCFDDRATQLTWLVALTDVVAGVGVWEPLQGANDKTNRVAPNWRDEGGEGRLFDRVQSALSDADIGNTTQNESQEQEETETEAIEVVKKRSFRRSLSRSIGVSIRMFNPASETVASPDKSRKVAAKSKSIEASEEDDHRKENALPEAKLYQSLAVVVISLVFEKLGCLQSSLLWKLVSAMVLCICFLPEKPSEGKKKEGANENLSLDESDEPTERSLVAAAELMKSEGVPLCPAMPSITEPPRTDDNDDDNEDTPAPAHRREPLTEDEMKSNLHQRWAMSAPTVDLSGQWTLIVDPAFKTEYADYLKKLGFNGVTRKVACSVIARTSETTAQSDNGRELYLKGTNPKGAWERTLTASGFPDFDTLPERKEGEDYSHTRRSIKTADSEDVEAEAWWEEGGTKHRSWLRGGKKYGGGDFESLRYLEEGSEGTVLVCESCFWPKDASKEKAVVTWRFKREDPVEPI